ncbi:MAG: hypothetical protein HUU46_24175 [Candidatus Hydrogenedentes bacterium]|nr:hypothetical protein [Candidatus Hydrogenedentota bacterium]
MFRALLSSIVLCLFASAALMGCGGGSSEEVSPPSKQTDEQKGGLRNFVDNQMGTGQENAPPEAPAQ